MLYSLHGTPQELTLDATAAQSAAFASSEILVQATADCFFSIGADPTAEADGDVSHFLKAGVVLPLKVRQTEKMSVIQADVAGNGYKVYISLIG